MKRRLFALLSALSLLLFVAVVMMCVRSSWREDGISYHRGERAYSLTSANGHLGFIAMRITGDLGQERGWSVAFGEPATVDYDHGIRTWLACRCRTEQGSFFGTSFSGWKLVVPYTYAFAAVLFPPTLWLVLHLRHQRRRRRNHCLSCGYDLRATPHRCPECGEPAAPAGVQSSP